MDNVNREKLRELMIPWLKVITIVGCMVLIFACLLMYASYYKEKKLISEMNGRIESFLTEANTHFEDDFRNGKYSRYSRKDREYRGENQDNYIDNVYDRLQKDISFLKDRECDECKYMEASLMEGAEKVALSMNKVIFETKFVEDFQEKMSEVLVSFSYFPDELKKKVDERCENFKQNVLQKKKMEMSKPLKCADLIHEIEQLENERKSILPTVEKYQKEIDYRQVILSQIYKEAETVPWNTLKYQQLKSRYNSVENELNWLIWESGSFEGKLQNIENKIRQKNMIVVEVERLRAKEVRELMEKEFEREKMEIRRIIVEWWTQNDNKGSYSDLTQRVLNHIGSEGIENS